MNMPEMNEKMPSLRKKHRKSQQSDKIHSEDPSGNFRTELES